MSIAVGEVWDGSLPCAMLIKGKHYSNLYPMSATVKRTCAAELKRYEVSKGTVRFPLDRPLPSALLKRLVKARIAELREQRSTPRKKN
jgi:uncharacterized protein YdhG (YjbR/CyaY superfamily)